MQWPIRSNPRVSDRDLLLRHHDQLPLYSALRQGYGYWWWRTATTSTPVNVRAFLLAALLTLLAGTETPLRAHTMNVGQITLKVADQRVFVALTVYASMFASADAAGIAAQIERSITVFDGVQTQSLKGILVSRDDDGHKHEGGPVLLIVGVALFDRTPDRLELAVTPDFLRRSGPLTAIATRRAASGQLERRTASITPTRPRQRL